MRRTKIVATIGPASRDPEVLARMVEAGMDVARLNFSHGNLDEHAETAERVREAANRAGRPVAILQDLPGPKLRIGALRDGHRRARRPATRVTFECGVESDDGDSHRMSVSWAELADAVEPDAILYLADGVGAPARDRGTRRRACELDAEVEIGGAVASRQGLNIPGPVDRLPAVPQRDLELLRHGESIGVDLVALSFVRSAADVEFVREHTRLPLIAKIEKPQAVENAEEILRAADCVMVARGDLGIELPIEDVPLVQKRLLKLAGELARPSITATQMLDSMVRSSRPDARRGRRRRQRDPRRHRRRDALAGDRGRRAPGRRGRDDGRDRGAHRGDAPTTASGTSAASRATRATPPTRSPTAPASRRASSSSTRSSCRRCRAARRGWSPRTARTCRSTRSRPAARPSSAAG